ncbi:MAG: TrkA C-terminal domain-containing protein [Desulfobacterales bacterium]
MDEDTDIHIEEIAVADSSKLVGVSLQESGIRPDYNLMIISIVKIDGKMLFNPAADTTIKAGEKVIAVGSIDDLGRLEKALNP